MTTLAPAPTRTARPAATGSDVLTWAAPTAWGPALIRAAGETVIAIDPPARERRRGGTALVTAPAVVRDLAQRLAAYVEGDPVELASDEQIDDWLRAAGLSGFRHKTLLTLARIPFGVTVTYGELAELAGRPRAARAAGSACAHNPLAIVVPCHRALPASGGVGSFGFLGPEYKRRLLELERSIG